MCKENKAGSRNSPFLFFLLDSLAKETTFFMFVGWWNEAQEHLLMPTFDLGDEGIKALLIHFF